MPRVLQLEATTSGGGGMWCRLICPSGGSAIVITAGMAVEIIGQITADTPVNIAGGGSYHADHNLYITGGLLSPFYGTQADQNGWYQVYSNASTNPNDLYPWVRGRWYRRVISLDFAIGRNMAEVDLYAAGSAAGTYTHRFAQVSITRYQRPVYWLYKDGMPLPDVSTLVADSGTTVARLCLVDMHEHFPLLCTTEDSPDMIVDSITNTRSSGSTLRRWVEWAGRKAEFALEFPAMIELERQSLEAFYDVYRGGDDWFFWQHRSNYPDQRVVILEPPNIVPIKLRGGADMRYRASVRLGEI